MSKRLDTIATATRDAVAWLEASTGLTLSDDERAAVAYGVRVGYHVALSTAPELFRSAPTPSEDCQ